jgi:hypothetical protein
MIWPGSRKQNFLIALLLLIYPGFLSQPNPIDYQSQLLSFCLAFASIAFTVKGMYARSTWPRLIWSAFSIIAGVIYPALVEYMIGLEVLRLALIVQIVLQEPNLNWIDSTRKTMLRWLPFLAAPLLFLLWRIFLFESERRATDLGSQIGQLFTSPLTGGWWLVNWVQDAFRVMVLAWTVPFNNLVLGLRLKEFLSGFGIGLLNLLLVVVIWFRWRRPGDAGSEDGIDQKWKRSTFVTGSLTAALALLPVIVVNRHVDFGEYSRYSLASAAGVAMCMVAFLYSIRHVYLRFTLVGLIILMASCTHYANAANYAREARTVRNFWWQVVWRAPAIQPGTTLIANYPVGGIQEDYFVWGPANLIYYPEKQDMIPIQIKLPAAVLTDDVVLKVMVGKGAETPLRRGNQLTRDFSDVLVMTQSSENSCVRIIDGTRPGLSIAERHNIILVAPYSQIGNVTTDGNSPIPPIEILGEEPAHDWCYYYQKADLARQRGDWEEIVRLGEEARRLGLHPNDQIEWMPFLQGYAFAGNSKQVKGISTRINTEPFYQAQACRHLQAMTENGYPLSPEMSNYVNELFCT